MTRAYDRPEFERTFREWPAIGNWPYSFPSRYKIIDQAAIKPTRVVKVEKVRSAAWTFMGWLFKGFPIFVLIFISVAAFGQILHLTIVDRSAAKPPISETLAMAGLWFCSICYIINRFGAARRTPVGRVDHIEARTELTSTTAPHITVLIPSYCEEPRVIRMTVLSAALAIYPARNIAVLIDDPISDAASVARSLATVESVKAELAIPVAYMRDEQLAWLRRRRSQAVDVSVEINRLAANLQWLIEWLDSFGDSMVQQGQPSFAHIDQFFNTSILVPLVDYCNREILALQTIKTVEAIDLAFAQLTYVFCTDITTFQRKKFHNLSHASNKAMNLNAYISLMGGSFRRRSRMKSEYLRAERTSRPDFVVRRPDYVLTLDADSLIRPQYMLDLVAILENDQKLAVAQTPYLSFPHSRAAVERIAGATTDIQYLVHQGSGFFGAGFWVGANALIRFAAFKDIETSEEQNGMTVPVFIQDRTVIEDTGSTIDLLSKGWRIFNHFAPLAHSATPADLGALCIQRKRWSNGGLLIMGGLLRATVTAPRGSLGPLGLFLRTHYLLSPLIGNICLFMLIINSTPSLSILFWMALAVLPYFLLYGLDLRRLGYRFTDLLPVSALNLILLPVALAGVAESVVQFVTGRKTSFIRTPKVEGRTAIPAVYVVFYLLIVAYMLSCIFGAALAGEYWSMLSPGVNAFLVLYGIARFIGFGNALRDCARLWTA
jgi:cellulose synthase (UDP-forming)